jgi:hypothetical protein
MKFWLCWLNIFGDLLRLLGLGLRSKSSLAAENLFLRKQLAFYRERKIKPLVIGPVHVLVQVEFSAGTGRRAGSATADVRKQNHFIDRLFDLAA